MTMKLGRRSQKMKKCTNCNKEYDDARMFCPECGTSLTSNASSGGNSVSSPGQNGQNVHADQEPAQEEEKGMSIASMVLGIVGFVAWCLPIVGYPVTIVGIVLGAKGMKKGGKGMAVAGIIMCSITLLLTLINSVLGAVLSVADLL